LTHLAGARVLSLDGDGTLWDFDTSMREALAETASRMTSRGLTSPEGEVTVDWLVRVRDEVARAPRHRAVSMATIRRAAFEEALVRCGHNGAGLVTDLFELYVAVRFERLRPYPEVPAALERIGRTHRLMVVTNGNTHPSRLGLDGVFDAVIAASDCGLFKPDPAIYHHAAAQVGVGCDAVLHVGDDPVEDVAAATRAGMAAIWLNRTGRPWPLDGPPPPSLTTLAELLNT
jgi:putative hydrolase of the HAD superfamily